MIRLIASDMDGTLLNSQGKVPGEMFELIRRLNERGICFAACSGRQYSNLRRLFWPIAEEIDYVCDNGASAFAHGQMIHMTEIPRGSARELTEDIQALGMDPLISSVTATYVFAGNKTFTDDIVYRLRNCTVVVDSFEEITEPVVKVSGRTDISLQSKVQELRKKWGGSLSVTAGGPYWADCSLSDKSGGLQTLLFHRGISPEEVMAFGDSFNDEPMLDLVGIPWIRNTADCRLQKPRYRVFDDEVQVLSELLVQLEGGSFGSPFGT